MPGNIFWVRVPTGRRPMHVCRVAMLFVWRPQSLRPPVQPLSGKLDGQNHGASSKYDAGRLGAETVQGSPLGGSPRALAPAPPLVQPLLVPCRSAVPRSRAGEETFRGIRQGGPAGRPPRLPCQALKLLGISHSARRGHLGHKPRHTLGQCSDLDISRGYPGRRSPRRQLLSLLADPRCRIKPWLGGLGQYRHESGRPTGKDGAASLRTTPEARVGSCSYRTGVPSFWPALPPRPLVLAD